MEINSNQNFPSLNNQDTQVIYPAPKNNVKPALVAVIILLLIIIIGGGGFLLARYLYSLKPASDITYQQSAINQSKANSFSNLNTEKVATTPASIDKLANWKTYTDKNGKFVFRYPFSWTADSPIFKDEKGNKVAELYPGHLTTEKNITCADFDRIIEFGGEVRNQEIDVTNLSRATPKVISQEDKIINGSEWSVRVVEVVYDGGSLEWNGIWYPNEYCLKKPDENRLFKINFYEYSPKAKSAELYNQILSSFKFL